jgi:DNA-binding LytR/AlgR family response regulator
MYSAIIADDEPLLRRELREALHELWPELRIVEELADGAAALEAIERHAPSASFLDMRMPKLTGLEVAERAQGTTNVVYVTAYDEHAVAAFEQGAVDYVLKPIRRARLAATVERLRQRLAALRAGGGRPRLQWIQASVGNTLRFVPVDEICYFKSDGKYTRVATAHFEAYIRRSLISLLDVLDPDAFWQIHRGIVVGVRHIESVTREAGGEMVVRVRGLDVELPVSKAHQGRFRAM